MFFSLFFSWEKFSFRLISDYFLSHVRKCPSIPQCTNFLWKIPPWNFPPHGYFSSWIVPLNNFCIFPNNKYYMWTVGRLRNLQPIPQRPLVVMSSSRHSHWTFQLCWARWHPQILIECLWGKRVLEGVNYLPSNPFGAWKSTLELLIFVQMSPCPNLLGHDHPREKMWRKIQTSIFLQIWAWILYSRALWYSGSDGAILIKITCVFWGCFVVFFWNHTNFLMLVAFDGKYFLEREREKERERKREREIERKKERERKKKQQKLKKQKKIENRYYIF